MVTGLDSITTDLTVTALDMLLLRHRVIANNIANQASQGYRPLRLEFEHLLDPVRAALDSGQGDDAVRGLLADVRGQSSLVRSTEETVRLDNEMTELARNTLQYQALLSAIEKLGVLKRLAIKGE